MEVIKFIISNIDNIALIIAAIVSLAAIIKKGETKILKKILFSLVTEAEQMYGNGTGILKSAVVADWIYQRIPSALKTLFTDKDIEKMIEDVLAEAKEKWEKNPNFQEYIQNQNTQQTATVEDLKEVVNNLAELAFNKAVAGNEKSE